MEQLDRIVLVDNADFYACIDEFRIDGRQMLVIHITVHRSTPRVIKDIRKAFSLFRSCTDAPLFAFEPEPDDKKWERFVSSLNFSYCGTVSKAWDGRPRRFFLSVPNHGRKDHTEVQ
jgi:hypothetical protein